MPRGVYPRKKKLGQILFTDTTRLDLLRWEQRCDTAAYWALQIIGLLCLITMTAMFGVVIYRGITGLSCIG